MKGGVILTREGNMIDGILHMVEHGTLSLVTNESKHGIIFKIVCDDTPFIGMDHEPIQTICLKLCVLETVEPFERIIGGIEKYDVDLTEFNHEITLQNDIFLAMATTSPKKVCPGIIAAMVDKQDKPPTFFQTVLDSLRIQPIEKTLLQRLSTKGDKRCQTIIQELIRTRLPIGIICMEMIDDAVTYFDLYKEQDDSTEVEDAIKAVAQLIRIFYRRDDYGVVGTIHCDCHLGNILKKKKSTDVVIIDFGTTVDSRTTFTDADNFVFMHEWGKSIMDVYEKCSSFDIMFTKKNVEEVAELLNFFIFMDSIKNRRYGGTVIQMNNILYPLLREPDNIKPFEKVDFNPEYCQMILDECRKNRVIDKPHTRGQMAKLQAQGRMFQETATATGKLGRTLRVPKRNSDPSLRPMDEADQEQLFLYLTNELKIPHENAHEIVQSAIKNSESLFSLIEKAKRGGNNKRLKNVSKHSTAQKRNASRRQSTQRKKSGTLRRMLRK
jgi:hypothetical protein